MTEELKQKAEEYAQKYINHKMAIHDIFDLEVVQKDITRLLIEFTAEITKELQEKIKDQVCEVGAKEEVIDYAKSIIKSLLDNSDEYAEQRAREFLKETSK